MPFIHLANGETLDLSDKEWQAAQDESGTPNAYHKDGKGSHVIGVYPADYEYEQDDTEKNELKDRQEYEDWKANRNSTPGNIADVNAPNNALGTRTATENRDAFDAAGNRDDRDSVANRNLDDVTDSRDRDRGNRDRDYVAPGDSVTLERDRDR